jgi:predicted ester cyclase
MDIREIREAHKAANAAKARIATESLYDYLTSDDPESSEEMERPLVPRSYVRALSDMNVTISGQIVAGDRVAARWLLEGTHDHEFQGIPPTNRSVTISGVTVSEVGEEGVKHLESFWDLPGLMAQIGGV